MYYTNVLHQEAEEYEPTEDEYKQFNRFYYQHLPDNASTNDDEENASAEKVLNEPAVELNQHLIITHKRILIHKL